MRLFVILLLIMGLATCASVIPQSEIITPASPALSGLQRYQLIAPEQALQGEPPFRQRYAELASSCKGAWPSRAISRTPGIHNCGSTTGWPCRISH